MAVIKKITKTGKEAAGYYKDYQVAKKKTKKKARKGKKK